MNEVVELYLDSGDNPSIRQIEDEFKMTPLKIRKLLIIAGAFSSDICEQVLELSRSGMSVQEIQRITGLSRASVQSYLPYSKIIYNAEEISLNTERIRLYRERKLAVDSFREKMKENVNVDNLIEVLWGVLNIYLKHYIFTIFCVFHRKGKRLSLVSCILFSKYTSGKISQCFYN